MNGVIEGAIAEQFHFFGVDLDLLVFIERFYGDPFDENAKSVFEHIIHEYNS